MNNNNFSIQDIESEKLLAQLQNPFSNNNNNNNNNDIIEIPIYNENNININIK